MMEGKFMFVQQMLYELWVLIHSMVEIKYFLYTI